MQFLQAALYLPRAACNTQCRAGAPPLAAPVAIAAASRDGRSQWPLSQQSTRHNFHFFLAPSTFNSAEWVWYSVAGSPHVSTAACNEPAGTARTHASQRIEATVKRGGGGGGSTRVHRVAQRPPRHHFVVRDHVSPFPLPQTVRCCWGMVALIPNTFLLRE